jgi:hypothetical protein
MSRETKPTNTLCASSALTGEPNIGIVVLAAGASRRMGGSKQLLRLRGETLLRRATAAALASQCRPAHRCSRLHAFALCTLKSLGQTRTSS